ncbi:uncharacterized protein EDB91DRAFT_704498 [Suillus paluster]|uniref:uncharacterized protein n=1 Tax=Suillus paluster TaxID=48578 RepID=UPI001B865330|nr:uncharacterized protein EDB91DRAFT_704498 [Suillus paluster]KAG1732013.1 hypothetical protein EDB91DRAFT_704498 [Suillus paluster]
MFDRYDDKFSKCCPTVVDREDIKIGGQPRILTHRNIMSGVVVDNSPDWWPTLQAVQLSNFCSIAAVAVVWHDYSLLFTREVGFLPKGSESLSQLDFLGQPHLEGTVVHHVEPIRSGSLPWNDTCVELFRLQCKHIHVTFSVAIDRFENWGSFVFQMTSQAIMSMRIYAMYMQSRTVLALLTTFFLATAGLGIAVGVTVLGPKSGISATEFVLSGINVCGPSVNTASSLPLAYDIFGLCTSVLQFALAVGRFTQHALEMRQMLHRWQVNEFMKILVQDSILYFLLNVISTVIFMISVWGQPQDSTYFAVVTAYTQNQSSVLVPRLVISFREHHSHGRHLNHSKSDDQKEQETMRFHHPEHSQDLEMRSLEE